MTVKPGRKSFKQNKNAMKTQRVVIKINFKFMLIINSKQFFLFKKVAIY